MTDQSAIEKAAREIAEKLTDHPEGPIRNALVKLNARHAEIVIIRHFGQLGEEINAAFMGRKSSGSPSVSVESVERILQVAVLGSDGVTIHTQPRPARHGNVMRAMWNSGHGNIDLGDQGFITTAGRFVGREEAFTIAHNAGQIITADAKSGHLLSEDVW